jgi:diguanylate cyclase (GGDEF)-like protein
MNAVCGLSYFGRTKFDELGRQSALDRLAIVETPSDGPFEQIVELVKATFNVPICAVSLIDNDRQWFKAYRGLDVDRTPREIAFCDYAIRAEEPFAVEDATSDPRFCANPLVFDKPFIRSYLGYPLKLSDGYIVGTLCIIDKKPRAFTQHEVAILSHFANLVVGELELRTMAYTDVLTKLLSRRAWRDSVQKEIGRAERQSLPLSILMLDLDHFKRVNDRFGHETGDRVLKKTAQAINSIVRKHDLAGRLGGEEFAVCLIGASLETATRIADRIREQVSALLFHDVPDLRCTISVGVAELLAKEDLNSLLKRADEALYAAKKHGRNQVQLASSGASVEWEARSNHQTFQVHHCP